MGAEEQGVATLEYGVGKARIESGYPLMVSCACPCACPSCIVCVSGYPLLVSHRGQLD
ncbi:hypothetical protein M6B38_184810 [Iris pallida]|uniref:Uncharacterized protein n=1 Tax=Iris pallida TaxID=29817 RepID=A0AAX6EKX9_IRIPA|nr:hypothetical protein M6B38_184810 [Iris pallida]